MNTPQAIPATASMEQNLPPLPRINVHVFCDTQETMQVMRAVAADRRMSRTFTEVFAGGIPAAVRHYATTTTPHLLVVESSKGQEEMLSELAALAQVCSPETRVVVIGHVNDISFYRLLMSQGVADYLAAPVSVQQILASFSSMFRPDSEKLGRMVTFLGAKGGVGASVIAHNVAWLMSERHETGTVIADLDLAFGTAGLDFNVDPAQGILDALASRERLDSTFIDRLLHKCSERLMLLASPGSVDKVIDIQSETLEMVLDILRSTSPWTVVDMPTTWADWMKAALVQTDTLVIVSTPELAALRNARSMVDMLKTLRPNDEPPLLVLNQVNMGDRPEIPAAKFSDAVGLEVTAEIPFDAQVFGQAVTAGQMVAEVAPKSQAARELERVSRRILGIEEKEETGRKSLFRPILEKLVKKG